MSVSPAYRAFVLDSLARVVPGLRSRAMFGGVGIYAGDVFFALIASDVLYLKVDETNRGDFEARGLGPFRPFGESGEVMQYYELPNDVVEDPGELRIWAAKSIDVARRKRKRGMPNRPSSGAPLAIIAEQEEQQKKPAARKKAKPSKARSAKKPTSRKRTQRKKPSPGK